MDWRLLIVVLPLLLALGWVAKNIGQEALRQGKDFMNKST
ncbi:MAG: photosystem II protein Y [Synechococcales cyanobacterium C42_A2020_086]|jgi:photosystem II PsbY protein|nr:photosystem II protein Y [Synechococcales cyanobacterium M58_A2018_015]MBF2075996.1 photosystem II protein Y [Synechococcales cyanobacterium C42_A2020_086]